MSQLSDNTYLNINIKLLSSFIYEFNVTRRHVLSYPGNHPIIAASCEKTIQLLRQVIAGQPGITIGIARDSLVIGDTPLEKNNRIFRDLAQLLFGQGVATVSFAKELTSPELVNFCKIISVKREALDAKGGIEKIMSLAAVNGIQVSPIDYSAFLAAEDGLQEEDISILQENTLESIWQEFVRSLLQGTLIKKSDLSNVKLDITPAELAELLNKNSDHQLKEGKGKPVSQEQIIAAFLLLLEQHPHHKEKEELLNRLNAFVSRLTPELQSQFLSSTFKSLAEHRELAESFLSQMPEEMIIDALDGMISRKEPLPQVLLSLIGKLSANLAEKAGQVAFEQGGSERENLESKLRELFKEEKHDKFTPENYQAALKAVIDATSISSEDRAELEVLRRSLDLHSVEGEVSLILLDIINSGFDDLGGETMLNNLLDLSNYFLSSGDFAALIQIHDKINCQAARDENDRYGQIVKLFEGPEFVQEILQGVTFWGKTKYQEIGNLIVRIGPNFVAPILDRLAEEHNMSVRRYYIELLQRIGDAGREEVISRLRDSRWYFVRNLILVLRSYERDNVLLHLRRLTNHPHPRVRQESIKALLEFRDPEADALIMRDLGDSDRETVINAVRMAEQSQNRGVIKCLADFLDRKGLTGFEYELKSAAIHSLGVIGSPESLTAIRHFMGLRSLFRGKQLNALKIEAIRSMNRYPSHLAVPLLEDISKSGHRAIREVAGETLLAMQGGEQ